MELEIINSWDASEGTEGQVPVSLFHRIMELEIINSWDARGNIGNLWFKVNGVPRGQVSGIRIQ